ncbi:hypothetical protein SAMN05660916_03017 [Arthrobacter sp. 31Cvi3.1E]|nr:hypothetical protein SAMN05660916_03017 [Arthrobacter sp. 31Cvi3.1E]
MSHSTPTPAAASRTTQATQELRDLIEASTWGGASGEELHAALEALERRLGIEVTVPTDSAEEASE